MRPVKGPRFNPGCIYFVLLLWAERGAFDSLGGDDRVGGSLTQAVFTLDVLIWALGWSTTMV